MSERNMACTSHSVDMEIDQQGQDRLNPEPSFYSGNNRHYTHPTMYPSSSSGSANLRHFPDTRDSAVFYGSQYNRLHHHNSDFGALSSFHNPCMVPPMPHSSGVFPAPRVSADQLPSSSRHGLVGGGGTEFGASHHFVDDVRGLSKRKNVGMVPGNHQVNGSTSSSSSYLGMLPQNSIGMEQHESRTNGVAPVVGGRAGRSTGSRSRNIGLQMESPMIHNTSYLAHGNYMGHSFQPTMWAEPRFGSTGNDGSAPTWGYTPAVSYLNVHGVPSEVASMGGQGYPDAMSSRNSTVTFSPPPPMHHHHHFHPSPTMQAMHVHNGYHNGYHHEPFQPSLSGQVSSNNLRHGTINYSLDDSEPGSGWGSRYPRQLTSNGIQMYRPHRSAAQQTVQVDRSLPYLTYLIEDEVAILELPDFYVGVESFSDRHRDMRLDIDHMSYEELLALGERIGNVTKGLTEETIESRLKTRVYTSSAAEGKNQEESCIVCQVEYQPRERIGTLKCGHEYHAECIKRWLQVKNECPVCKVPAIDKDDGRTTKGETGCYFYPYA